MKTVSSPLLSAEFNSSKPCCTPNLFPSTPAPRVLKQILHAMRAFLLCIIPPAQSCHHHTWIPIYCCITNCHLLQLIEMVGSGDLIKVKFCFVLVLASPVPFRVPVENRNTPGPQPRWKQQVVVISGNKTGDPGRW